MLFNLHQGSQHHHSISADQNHTMEQSNMPSSPSTEHADIELREKLRQVKMRQEVF